MLYFTEKKKKDISFLLYNFPFKKKNCYDIKLTFCMKSDNFHQQFPGKIIHICAQVDSACIHMALKITQLFHFLLPSWSCLGLSAFLKCLIQRNISNLLILGEAFSKIHFNGLVDISWLKLKTEIKLSTTEVEQNKQSNKKK